MSIIFTLLIFIPFFLCVPTLIGIYVFRDARRRRMNAPLWTLIAIAAPMLMGFIIYLLARSSHSDWKCPQCAGPVTEQFVVCPQCGTRLKPACPHCSTAVETDWKVCPRCGDPLTDTMGGCTPPVRHTDKWLGKLLLAILLIPLALLLLLFLAFQASNRVGAMNTTYLTADSYLEAKADHWSEKQYAEVSLWLDSCLSDPDRAYVLRHRTEHNGEHIIQYLIYYPTAGEYTVIDSDHDTSLLGTKLTVDFQTGEDATGYDLCTVSIYAERTPKLEILSDGEEIEYEITDVSYGLTLFEMLSQEP